MSLGADGTAQDSSGRRAADIGDPPAIERHLRHLATLLLDELHAALSRRMRLETTTKSSAHDLVSDADRAIERLVFDATRAAFPEDGFLGEEGGWRSASTGARDWVVDPIDGTMNFVHGVPVACSAVGVRSAGVAVAGLVVDPFHDDVYLTAGFKRGTEKNGDAVAVSPGGDLSGRIVLVEVPSGVSPAVLAPVQQAVIDAGGSPRTMGSGALAMALVAAGIVQGVVHGGPSIWDVAAGVALVEHAGGVVLGRRDRYVLGEAGPLVAGAPETADRLQEALSSCTLTDAAEGRRC